jgi:hypothetical protein
LTVSKSFYRIIVATLLIMHGLIAVNAQTSVLKDTISIIDTNITEVILYSSNDSIYNDLSERKVHLYGNAKVEMGDIKLTAGYILIDLNANEIQASFRYDKDSNKLEFPNFTDGQEAITCLRMRYNTKTEKGYIEELALKQDELYFHMGEAKKYPNDEIHLKKGRLTTCDLDDPHYHFLLSKAVMVPDKRIVTGPINLWVKGIPTPLGLPFAIIPQQKERTHGLLFPEFIPISQYGFGLQNLGYYFPINDRLQTSAYINLYSRGSWGLRNDLDYSRRYAFSGRLSVGAQQFRQGFPYNNSQNKVSIVWTHRKEAKSNPLWAFSSNVNFISDNNTKNNLDPINPQYFNNSFNSDINLNRTFPGKPITMGMKISLRQNSIAKNISLTSPIFNANITRVFPFKNIVKNPKKEWQKTLARIGLSYSMESQNKSTFSDSLLTNFDFQGIGNEFMNGVNQAVIMQTTTGFFKNAVKITPSLTYGNKINFQQIEKKYNPLINGTQVDTITKTGMANEFSMNINLTTVLYSYYRFIGKNKPLLRHLMTPSIGYRFVPLINPLMTANAGANQSLISYSSYERSIYNVGNSSKSSFLTFGINNSLELKVKSQKDTLTGYQKIRLIDQFSITGNYDFNKDSMNLSNIQLNLRVSPFSWLNFVANAGFSPYAWNTSSGKTIGTYAIKTGQSLGRFLSNNFTSTLTFATRKSREIIEDTKETIKTNWNSDFNQFSLHPEQVIYFNIPWKVNLSHVYSINANTSKTVINNNDYSFVQTLVLNGDISFTKRWNMASNINFDIQSKQLTNINFSLNRNLHCWALSFYWTPIGGNKSFLLSIRNTSSIFRDAKIEVRKPPSFL